jgi:hypothetical protein
MGADAAMSKTRVHVLIPYTSKVACGNPGHFITGAYREKITCNLCRKTEEFKRLPILPKESRHA